MTAADLIALAKKHPVGTVCLLVTIACGAALYFRSGQVAASQAEYEARSAESAKMINNVTNAPGLDAQLEEITALAKELDGRLVRAGQLAVNLQYFYKLEADNGVKLLDVRQNALPRAPRGPKTIFTPVPYSLSVQGTYDELVKFLTQVEHGRHFCRINSLVLTKAGGVGPNAGQELNLSITLDLLGLP